MKVVHLFGLTIEIYQYVDPVNVNGKDSQNMLTGKELGMVKEGRMNITPHNSI